MRFGLGEFLFSSFVVTYFWCFTVLISIALLELLFDIDDFYFDEVETEVPRSYFKELFYNFDSTEADSFIVYN